MKVQFLATTMEKYAGHDGNGGSLCMTKGETATVSEEVALSLLKKYSLDFKKIEDTQTIDSEFSTDINKLYKKTAKFKSK